MPTTPPNLTALLDGRQVIAVLRAQHADQYLPVLRALVDGGVSALELTLTTPGTIAVLPTIVDALGPHTLIGVGTVLTPADAHAALDAGARFLVAPNTDPDVIAAATARGAAILPGVMTPTDVAAALHAGAPAVKVFPAQTLGPDYLAHLRGPFPDLQAVPSGGVDAAAARAWLAAGAPAVSIGGPLLGDALHGGDPAALTARARELVHSLQGVPA